jgi:hydrogenase nickel insertion protein HypA
MEFAEKAGAARVHALNMEIGEVALVNAEQLIWLIQMLTKETIASGIKIQVTNVPVKIHCVSCSYTGGVRYRDKDPTWHVAVPQFECCRCHSAQTVIKSGRELNIKDISVQFDDDEDGVGENDA